MSKKNLVVVIILNYNKKNDVLECIDSIYKQDYREFVVIVVDNASTDGSVESVRTSYPEVHLIRNKVNLGAVAGRNIGWRFAEENFDYEYLLFLDNDVILSSDFISKLITLFTNNTNIGIASGKAYTNNELNTIMSAGIKVNLYSGSIYDIGSCEKDNDQYSSGNRDACGAFAMMIRRKIFSEIRGFDNNYSPYGWEDVDLCLKAKKLGHYIYFLSTAVLIHKGTKLGRKPNPLYERSKIKNYIYLLRYNTNLFQKITCIVCLPFRAFFLSLKLIFNGNTGIVLEHFKGLFIGINNIRLSIKSNK